MWLVKIHRDIVGKSLVSYSKIFDDEDEAYDFFEEEVKDEFRNEIKEGLVTDQEIQNIINNEMYFYDTDSKEILIRIEEING